jgi:hypothetical protein
VDYVSELVGGGARLGVVWVVGFSIFFFLGENKAFKPNMHSYGRVQSHHREG